MRRDVELIKEGDGFYYISYSDDEIMSKMGGAYYIDILEKDGKIHFSDIFYNMDTATIIPTFLLDYIESFEGRQIEELREITMDFFFEDEVIWNES